MRGKYWKYISLGLLLFLIFTPKWIMYPDIKYISWSIFIIIFGILPYTIFKTIKQLKPYGPLAIIVALSTPLIIGPSYGFYHSYREINALKSNGKWTEATVIDKKWRERRVHAYQVKCSYEVENIKYETNYETDKMNIYDIGDKVKLIYNDDYPKIYRLENEWKEK